LFASLGLQGLVLALIGLWDFGLVQLCGVPSICTVTIVYCRRDCSVLARQYACSAVTSRDFASVKGEDFVFTQHGHGKLFGESLSEQLPDGCQSCCQRATVRGLVPE
jgi:hypothetical protein